MTRPVMNGTVTLSLGWALIVTAGIMVLARRDAPEWWERTEKTLAATGALVGMAGLRMIGAGT